MYESFIMLAIGLGFAIGITYYGIKQSKYGPQQTSSRVFKNQATDKGVLAAFTCYYRNVGTAELYIYKEKLICKSGDEIFFDLPIQSVESLEYSERNFFLLSARGQEYQLAYLHLPEEGMKNQPT